MTTQVDRRTLLKGTAATAAVGAVGLAGCTSSGSASSGTATATASSTGSGSVSLTLDEAAWNYDETNDVYWQIGLTYVARPAATDYETLGVFVPGAYLSARRNDDGTYTAKVRRRGSAGGFTARTAPVVFPVNTPGYAAQQPPSEYSYDSVSAYLEAGFVYVAAGLRGRDSNADGYTGNAPWGVTDLKAAVRYVRYNANLLPGDKDKVFVFGHSGGGAQSSVMGASGDSDLYTPYLRSIGAAMTTARGRRISDAVAGVMAWCPITGLDVADAAYEWNLGQFASTATRASGTWTAAYSRDLAAAYAAYVNGLGLRDARGRRLSLSRSAEGVYLAGSYHDHLVSVVEGSLNHFLADTTFPYTSSSTTMAGMGGGGAPSAGAPSGDAPSGEAPSGEPPSGEAPSASSGEGSSTTYETVEDYIAALNSDTTWVVYDAATNTATVTGLAGFVASQKGPSKDVGAFDGVDRSATENVVLGLGEDGLHFSTMARDVIAAGKSSYTSLSGWRTSYSASEYTDDFKETDSVGKDVAYRMRMYNPMHFLLRRYSGFRSATVAPHWRIRTGIMQGDTASTTEVNLALALRGYGIRDVDFETVWGQGHTTAERTGDATANFVAWVRERLA